MKTMARDICPHRLSRDPEDCWSCAKDELLNDLPDVASAVTARRSSAVRDIRVKGGAPNWVPIDEQAVSFTQDIVREGNRLLGRDLTDEHQVIHAVHQLVEVIPGAGAQLLNWRDRCRLITGTGDRPYLLTHATPIKRRLPDGQVYECIVATPTLCPVVDPKIERQCNGRLKVHPAKHGLTDSKDTIPVGAIICTRDRHHNWDRKIGWLRLNLLLKQSAS